MSRKIDTKLSFPLTTLRRPSSRPPPDGEPGRTQPAAGQAPRPTDRAGGREGDAASGQSQRHTGPPHRPRLEADKAPLWYYILKEAELPVNGTAGAGGRSGSSPKSSSGSCSGTRTRTCTSTRPGNPRHRSHRRPANSPSSTYPDTCRRRPSRRRGAAANLHPRSTVSTSSTTSLAHSNHVDVEGDGADGRPCERLTRRFRRTAFHTFFGWPSPRPVERHERPRRMGGLRRLDLHQVVNLEAAVAQQTDPLPGGSWNSSVRSSIRCSAVMPK